MTGAALHDIINFVRDTWNTLKVLRQAELLAAERLDALQLFELHMAVVEDLSRQHATEVVAPVDEQLLTIENALASMVAEEREKLRQEDGHEGDTPVTEWIYDGMGIEHQQVLVIVLLESYREHPLQDTWETTTKLRDSLNLDLKKFRERQRAIYLCLKLSVLDRVATGVDATNEDSQLQEAETKLRCSEANSGILAVRAASLALSTVKTARDLDHRGQAGITWSQARAALIHLGHMAKDTVEPDPLLRPQDTWRRTRRTWFCAKAEMYRWLEQYEHKHAELMRVIERFCRNSVVWVGLADWEEERNVGPNGAATFAQMQAAMYRRLEHNAKVIFMSAELGTHHDWVSATTFDELVTKINGWRDVVFKWMDDMGIHRAYKDF
ncbi:hypothetical protein B0H10DRAFT_2206426 [Mycena sp. CBHHK59/15]|nr:hypothetical protein B0H10DRAFT_2206426 [Mycena sp. CBHHK59/15]